MSLRYGLIGAGMMGREHIHNVALIDGVEIAALADPDPQMRARAQAEARCPAYADHHAMLAEEALDALVIASPNHTHHPLMLDALATGLPILIEKPLGVSVAECDAIVDRARGRAAPVWVAMEYRYIPAIAQLIEEVRAGVVGTPRMLAIREHRFPFLDKVGAWNRFAVTSGGALVEKCCHFFDLMRLILGDEPVRLFASGAMDVNFLNERIDGRAPDVIDNAFVVLDFARGARAALDLCMFAEGAPFQEELSVTGERARIDARVPGPPRFAPEGGGRTAELAIYERASKRETLRAIEVDPTILAAGDHQGSTFHQHVRFLAALRGEGPVEVGLDDGRRAVAIGAAAEESVATGRVVEIGP